MCDFYGIIPSYYMCLAIQRHGERMNDNHVEPEVDDQLRIMVGVPGFSTIFPKGIMPGSLILVLGPPGSGKTLLAMQLLMEMRWAGQPADSECTCMFFSADEGKDMLERQQDGLLKDRASNKLIIEDSRSYLDGIVEQEVQEYKEEVKPEWHPDYEEPGPSPLPADGSLASEEQRRKAVQLVLTRMYGAYRANDACALGIDGIANLPEFRGRTADERREALHEIVVALKKRVSYDANKPHNSMAAVMTVEAPMGADSLGVTQLEEYLADIVIHVGVVAPSPGKTRRFLEVRKARYIDSVSGQHSLWIMSPDEVARQKAAASSLGWSEYALSFIRKGVVVFPRMRWRLERGTGPFSSHLENALLSLRKHLSSNSDVPEKVKKLISGTDTIRIVADILRGWLFDGIEAERTSELIKTFLDTAIKTGWRWPVETKLPDIEPEEAKQLRLSWAEGLPACEIQDLLLQVKETLKSTPAGEVFKSLAELLKGALNLAWDSQQIHGAVLGALEIISIIERNLYQPVPTRCLFGVQDLDEMFGLEDDGPGVTRGSSTALVGGPGTGKSMLAYCFMLRGLVGDSPAQEEDVICLSFDERHKRVLRDAGNLVVLSPKNHQLSPTLAEMAGKQILESDLRANPNFSRLRYVYENPSNVDLDRLMCLLGREIESLGASRDHLGKQGLRRCRLIIDSLSDLERSIADPLIFNDFVTTLLNKAIDWNVTSLLVYEMPEEITAQKTASKALSFMADNVILLRQVQVNNVSRKCVTIQKARGRRHDPAVAELVFVSKADGTFHLEVRKGFEGMTKVLTGHPEPANIELRLFHENEIERKSNEQFFGNIKDRFGDRVRYVPFSLYQGRRAFWHRLKGGDIRPDADVTVVSLDQPWVRIFADKAKRGDPLLATWTPAHADASQRLLVSQILPQLRQHAEVGQEQAEYHGLRPMLAWPHYFDFGLLLERTDLLSGVSRPTHWDALSLPEGENCKDVENRNAMSFEQVVGNLSQRLGVPGFAFNMDSVETVACVFIEMCWNFYAKQAFFQQGHFRDWNIARATEALAFIARLRWQGTLPFPCTLEHCARAIYTRVWYANVPNLIDRDKNRNITFMPVAFLTSLLQFQPQFVSELKFLQDRLDNAEKRYSKLESEANDLFTPGHGHRYPERMADFAVLHQVWENKRRLQERQRELKKSSQKGLPGWSCCGAWFLGVLSSGGNANLGWSLVQEATDPRRVEERALAGAGLPPLEPFYKRHARRAVPGLQNTTFGYLEQNFFGRIRPRETVLGIGLPGVAAPDSLAIDCLSILPEVLHGLVMSVLGDERSNPESREYKVFIQQEVERVFEQIDQALGSLPTKSASVTV
jgi:KaiC/GvpD/RAD55 family RecA-like ATPase